jgi:predicted RND superfamily exporter protein
LKRVGEHTFKKISYFVLTIVLLLTIYLGFQIPNTRFDYNFEDFFPAADEEADFFFAHRALFESDNDFILITIENDGSVFDSTFLRNVHSFSAEVDSLDLVKFTRDLTSENEVFIYANGFTGSRPYINFENIDLSRDSASIFENRELINTLINEDASAISVFVRHKDYLSKEKSDKIVEQITNLTEDYDFEKVRMAGRTVGQIFYIDTMTFEMGTYVGSSMILVVLFLLIAFRSAWGLYTPLLVIAGSMVWVIGLMAWIDAPINILLTILPSIMFVVAMSDVIHLVSNYIELLRQGKPKFEAIKTSFKEIGIATFLTSLTTSIGFFSLLYINVKPIQSFGLFVGIGVLMAFIFTFSVLPFLFYYTKTPKIVRKEKSIFWQPLLLRSFLFTLKNRKWIPWVSIVILGVFAYGATTIVSNNYIMDDMDPDTSIKKDFNYIDDEFGGVRPFEMAIMLEDTSKSIWDIEILKEIEQVEEYLQNTYGVTINNSLVQSISILNRASNAGDSSKLMIPNSKSKIKRFKRMLKVADQGGFLRDFLDSTETRTRINGNIPDWGNIRSGEKNDSLRAFIDENINEKYLDFKITGSAHLLDKNMSYMSSSLVKGLSFAILIVALIMGVIYKSLRMVIISVIPNIIPLIIIAGIMGFFEINLKITTAMVFTISFGIAVDDTIHFLSKFKLELNKGRSVLYALKRTYISTGKAIVLTSLILISGFLLLLMSDFLGTYYLGLMICITLVVAILADFYVLPLLLIYFFKQKKPKAKLEEK